MDQESLIQIQGIIGAVTESLRTDITDAKHLTAALGQELRADIADGKHLTAALGQELRADIADAKRLTEALGQELRTDIADAKHLTAALGQELRADIADSKRHAGVLTEGLRHELQVVAEGFQMHLGRRHAEERSHLDAQFRETRALVQLSYGQMQERVERLEQRVLTIEQHLGLPEQ